jgi:hypothetical protein
VHEERPGCQFLERTRVSLLKLGSRLGLDEAIDEEPRLTYGIGDRGKGPPPEGDRIGIYLHL